MAGSVNVVEPEQRRSGLGHRDGHLGGVRAARKRQKAVVAPVAAVGIGGEEVGKSHGNQLAGPHRGPVHDPVGAETDAEGRFLGFITMPDRFSPFSLRDDLLYGVWRDELDVESVRLYPLRR